MKYLKSLGKSLGKILMTMYVITALLLFLLAALVQKLQFDSKGISAGITAIYVISCFLGGFFAGKMKRQKKFLWGFFMGICYILIMLLVTLVAKEGPAMTFSGFFINLCICAGAGMLGGMIS